MAPPHHPARHPSLPWPPASAPQPLGPTTTTRPTLQQEGLRWSGLGHGAQACVCRTCCALLPQPICRLSAPAGCAARRPCRPHSRARPALPPASGQPPPTYASRLRFCFAFCLPRPSCRCLPTTRPSPPRHLPCRSSSSSSVGFSPAAGPLPPLTHQWETGPSIWGRREGVQRAMARTPATRLT